MGLIPEEIVRKFGHLSLMQVHAALAYCYANQAEIDADLEAEARETEVVEQQHEWGGRSGKVPLDHLAQNLAGIAAAAPA